MSQEDIYFYSKINKKKIKKSPILRVQIKKSQKIFSSKSTTNINRNTINLDMPKTTRQKFGYNPLKKYFYRNSMPKHKSSTYFPKNENNKFKLNKKPEEKKIFNRNQDNDLNRYYKTKMKKSNIIKTDFYGENKMELYNNKTDRELYCINCFNKIKNINKNFSQYINSKNSNDYNLQENLSLKQIDEDYINNKVIKNEIRQLAAFNYLKQIKDPKSKKDKLQYLYENSENPFHGLNLQDYLYYNNKTKNENRNNLVLNKISSYNLTQPRKEIIDYYDKVMFQVPLLEKDSHPSAKFKLKYLETLQKQIDETKQLKHNIKKAEQKKEKEELRKYNELTLKIEDEKKHKNKIKYGIIEENNNTMNKIKIEQAQLRRNENILGYQNKLKKFKERQIEYKSFINQQRINEINNMQNWIKENLKQKREQMDDKEKEDKKWKNYLKHYNESFYDNINIDKCAECNLISTNRLYPLQTS